MDIKATLATWLGSPEALRDDEIDPPTPTALRTAMALTDICPDFTRVVPSSDGGVLFTAKGPGVISYSMDVYDDGSLDYIVWSGTGIDTRMRWVRDHTTGRG